MKVYILSTHEESGAEEVRATLDPGKLEALLATYGPPNDEELARLRELIQADVADEDGQQIEQFYGGVQLHIIELV